MCVMFDVNGFKGPNRVGKDMFESLILRNGAVVPNFTSTSNSNGNITFGNGINNGKDILLSN